MNQEASILVSTTSSASTRRVAQALVGALGYPTVLALHGDLGAGKTTFVQGVVQGLAAQTPFRVQSPSYAVARTYPTSPAVHHLDLYRLDDEASCWDLGLAELVHDPNAICCVEWAQRAPTLFERAPVTHVYFPSNASRSRRLRVVSSRAPARLAALLAQAARGRIKKQVD